jgi:hypothetical protein
MKNILAENMLRFGVKNLSAKSKRKLNEQPTTPPTSNNITAELTKWNSNIPKFLDDSAGSPATTPNVFIDPAANIILKYEYTTAAAAAGKSSYPGSGTLHVYKVSADGGIPFIMDLGSFVNNYGSAWKKSPIKSITKIDSANLLQPIRKSFNQKDWATRFIDIWENNLTAIADQPTKNAAIQLIQTKQAEYAIAYQRVTRSETNLKIWWAPTLALAKPFSVDNPRKINESQYYLQVKNKVNKEPNARLVLNIINDTALENWIQYKVDNPKSNGEWPELKNKMPKPIIV